MRASGLWEALELARRANLRASGEPAPVPGETGRTRREVIIALAAAAGAAALPRDAYAAAPVKKMPVPPAKTAPVAPAKAGPVAIVGGGLAGLTALWTLTHAGVDARLYEARARLGGRMYTAKLPGGDLADMGGQLVNTDHHDMAELARTFGVGLIDRKAGRHRSVIFDGAQPVAEADAVEALRPLAAQMTHDADRLDRDYAGVAAELDRMSFTSYLDKHRSKLPQRWVRGLLETTARTEYGVEPGQASAIELMFNLPSIEGARVEVLSRSDERYLIAGGSSALVEAMAARVSKRIVTGKRVTAINPAPGGGARVVFADGGHVDAAAVIVATPASITRKIDFGVALPPLWKRFLLEANLGRNEKVQVRMRARAWEPVCGRGGELWRTDAGAVASGWDGGVRPHVSAGGVWTWFLGGDEVARAAEGDALVQARAFAASVEAGVPGMTAATLAAHRTGWHRDPLSMGGYVNYRPGQMTRFARLFWVEERGRASPPVASGVVHFAGEHLSDAFPGYMNGAAQTGRLAAEAVVAQLAAAKVAA